MFRAAFTDLYEMKADELFRNVPANIHELCLALAGLPKDMKVLAESEAGVSENTVDELCARTTWQPDFGGNDAAQAPPEISCQDK